MDGVMADAYQKFVQHYVDEIGPISAEKYNGKKIYDLPEARHMRAYLFEPGWFADLEVMTNAPQVIEALQANYEIFIVTAAQEFPYCLADKHAWLTQHFPFISWKNYVMCGDKSIVTGDYMIDDKISNLDKFDGVGLLYNAADNMFQDSAYSRVDNWLEVEAFFEKESNI